MSLKTIQDEIEAKRCCGYVSLFEIERPSWGQSLEHWLPAQLIRLGLASNMTFEEISAEDAERLWMLLMTKDLAYEADLMPRSDAVGFWRQILQFVGRPVRFLTNTEGLDSPKWSGSYSPISDATFEGSLVISASEASILILVQDED